jgi:thiamine biosynthesis lipoprotein
MSAAQRRWSLTFGLAWLLACTEPPPRRVNNPDAHDSATSPSSDPRIEAVGSADASGAFVPKKVSVEQKAMGTRVVIVAYTSPELGDEPTSKAVSHAFREIQRIEQLMSTWIETSEVSKINAAAGKSAVTVGPETLAVIEKSLWIAEQSGGLFDITFESMKGVWKFDEGAEPKVPAKDVIEKARKKIDYKQIEVDAKASTVKLKKPETRINLGGIAKGYAVDAAARALEGAGVKGYFIQAGGDLFVRGKKPDGKPFRVGVRDPRSGPDDSFALMAVEDHAFSTAGDYERAFVLDGKRYHHIIDPRTGYPATASRSVTVWAKDAFTADAIDDAVFILGPEKGLAFVESIDGAGAVIVDASNKVWISKRLEGLVQVVHPPTDAP